ncbi:MAG: hypothetical protein ACJA0Q_001881 [Saprospiraceae bacterium]
MKGEKVMNYAEDKSLCHRFDKNLTMTKFHLLKVTICFVMLLTLSNACKKKEGCTDSAATNYNSDAKKDDGSCVFESDTVITVADPTDSTCTVSEVTTLKVKVTGDNTATITGRFAHQCTYMDEGVDFFVRERGFVYGTSQGPTAVNNYMVSELDGVGPGTMNAKLTNLVKNTTYFVRAYIKVSDVTMYGHELKFTTTLDGNVTYVIGGGVTDASGNDYETVLLGNGQEWMKQDLKTMKYSNGDTITKKEASTSSHPNFTLSEGVIYKYNYYAIIDTRNACPTGWHVPSRQDNEGLTGYVGENHLKLKSDTATVWEIGGVMPSNESGFSSLPNMQLGVGTAAYYSTTLADKQSGFTDYSQYVSILNFYENRMELGSYTTKDQYLSVRCLKN